MLDFPHHPFAEHVSAKVSSTGWMVFSRNHPPTATLFPTVTF
jgi:hypothetical protein